MLQRMMGNLLLFLAIILLNKSVGVDCIEGIKEGGQGSKENRFQLSSSGLYIASNRGFSDVWNLTSGMLLHWSQMAPERTKAWAAKIKTDALSYVDTNGGHQLVFDSNGSLPTSISTIWKVVPRNVTNFIDDKLTFGKAAREAGLEGTFVPRTFETKEHAEDVLDPKETEIFFVKDRFGTKGKGITIHSIEELPNLELPKWHVIQNAVNKDLALYDDRKVTARLFFIVMHGGLFVHHSGWIKAQSSPYDPKATNHSTHVSHDYKSVYNIDLYVPPMEIDFHMPFHAFMYDERNWGPNFDMKVENATMWMNSFVDMGKQCAPKLLLPIIEYTRHNPHSFSLLGVDVVPLKNGRLCMLEINTYPSFFRFDITTDVILTMFGMDQVDQELEKRLTKVWEMPQSRWSEEL
jgi:hypothetical protein